MPHYKLALMGFGNVGKALARLLLEKQDELFNLYGLTFSVTGISTGSHGTAISSEGIDLGQALGVNDLNQVSELSFSGDAIDFIRNCPADVLFENTPVNYENGQPAIRHLEVALEEGMHAITANKGPLVHSYRQLKAMAEKMNRKFYFESTVMDGAPVFSLFRYALPGAQLLSFRGVLNSTTNMILTRMELGDSFEQAVTYCQEIGIAETDPSGDVDGWDAAIKVSALATVLMDTPLKPQEIERQGIRGITQDQITLARDVGKRWKLVCSAQRLGDSVQARVSPEMVDPSSPMFGVDGTGSIVQFQTDVLGLLTLVEDDPGPHTTAYGLLADFINAVTA
jgi:homoserine dehydrogenase